MTSKNTKNNMDSLIDIRFPA
uniref:Uncharacterized protein n=1 Tax=Anguilla anguilla TaxID=7936 RepID=A0A0E9XYP7_ANGAN